MEALNASLTIVLRALVNKIHISFIKTCITFTPNDYVFIIPYLVPLRAFFFF